ncbi:universal stress protein [Hymenobacter sp. 15J16-1T3B]|uniref:universal stress protein n=1 Tax=Hymenobacter sp. 15J16-1T3B TaxID=2886941 RepID=UPI001D10B476|nr:universal stress protein [Hymenobacter sp. 15J16-1T3B]MCC3156688.1 universal stress protein [Hymenobacter sp. 15J16-1T3B]
MPSRPIVVLTDFYAVSNRALSYAAGLAVPLQAHLVLLHVPHDELLAPPELAEAARRSPGQLRQALNALADAQPVPTQVDVEEGYLPAAVAEAVHQHQPQLLVLSRPADEVTPTAVVVGAAQDVLRHVPCPLLVVPHVGWGAFPPRRFALAVDGEPFSLYENEHLVPELLGALGGSLSILHVVPEPAGASAEQRVRREVERSGVAPLSADCHPHCVTHTDAAEGILQGAAEVGADLLVLVARRHTSLSRLFHRSVVAQLIGQSPLPLLLLPALD